MTEFTHLLTLAYRAIRDLLPLWESLVWPIFIGLLLWQFQSSFQVILAALAERVKSGSSIKMGPSGIEFGEAQLPPSATAPPPTKVDKTADGLPHNTYIVHIASRDARLDQAGMPYYRIKIWIDTDDAAQLFEIEKVIYHLHPSFADPNREAADQKSRFGIKTAAWGEFNMTAEIFFHDKRPKLVVERYINFLPSS